MTLTAGFEIIASNQDVWESGDRQSEGQDGSEKPASQRNLSSSHFTQIITHKTNVPTKLIA